MKCKCKCEMHQLDKEKAKDPDSYANYQEHITYRCDNCGIMAYTTGAILIEWDIPKILQKKYGKSHLEFVSDKITEEITK